MIKRISLLILAALLVATMAMAGLAAPAFAAKCPDGTVATNDRGDKKCETVEPAGNNQQGNTFEEETTQKGSFNSSHPQKTTCTNPGGVTHDRECPQ